MQGVAENLWVRLFVSHESGVGDGAKATGNSALLQYIFDSAIRIGDDCDLVTLTDCAQLLGGSGANRVPVAGVADAGDQLIPDGVVFVFVLNADLEEQLRVEHPPEAVVGAAVLGHHPVELIFGATFQVAQVLVLGYDAALGEWRVNALASGKQQCVANVKEDNSDFRVHGKHCFSIVKRATGDFARVEPPNQLN